MTPERLGSRYLLDERIGEGGLGVVWRGRDISDGTTYAIKLLRAEYAQDPGTVSRFVRERTALLRFRHPNVVTLHDMIVEGDRLALVMDFIASGDLDAYRRRRGGALPPGEAAELTAQICSALAAAHAAEIVHRDLKPANVLLDRNPVHGDLGHGDPGHGAEVRLTDFGIARVSGEPTVTTKGYFLGTLSYLAPEVIQGGEPTPACDIYAAGITLYELLAGQPPFTGQAAAVIYEHLQGEPRQPDAISEADWRLIAACLNKDPARRPTAAEVESALRGAQRTGAPQTGAHRTGSPQTGAHRTGTPQTGTPQTGAQRTATATSGWQAVELPSAWDRTESRPTAPAGTTSGMLAAPSGYLASVTGTGVAAFAQPDGGPTGAGATQGRQAAEAWSAAWPASGGMPETPVPGGPEKPRRAGQATRSRRRAAWIGGAIAVLVVAGAVGLVVTRSPASPAASATGPVAASLTATPRTGKSASPATSGASVTGSTSAPTSPTPQAPTGTSAPLAAAPSAAHSSTVPANTTWQCGPTEAATIWSTDAGTGQTMQACIRVYNGKLELEGTLSPTVASWDEQINLVLKNPAQQDYGKYLSPVCTAANCVFSVTITPPSSGDWTVIPQWERYNGDYQSTGQEPGFVYF